MQSRNAYAWTGMGLLVSGGLIFVSAYFILQQVWITALALVMFILAAICLALCRTIPKISPEVSSLLLETGTDNLNSLIEELGVRSRCVYLPSSLLTNRKPQALIPLRANATLPQITEALPQRLIVRYGARAEDIGLLVSTPGGHAIGLLEPIPGNSAEEMESALTRLLAGTLGVADSTKLVCQGNHIKVEIRNPRFQSKPGWCQQCLGGPLASMAATVAAEACAKPVTINREEQHPGKCLIELEVLA